MGEACRTFDTPVTGGNVSFYNEDPQRIVYPTPVVGMVGLIEDIKHATTQWFKDQGDIILLLGETKEELGASEYLQVIHNLVKGDTPDLNLEQEKQIQDAALEMIRKGLIKSAHDCSEGGLAVALAECCISSPDRLGADVKLVENPARRSEPSGSKTKGGEANIRLDTLLFGESQSRIVLTTQKRDLPALQKISSENQIPLSEIGTVGGENLRISDTLGENPLIDVPVSKLADLYDHAIERIMEERNRR